MLPFSANKIIIVIILLFQLKPLYAQYNTFLSYSIKQGLPGEKIYKLFEDKKGNIWAGTDVGIARFDGRKFKSFTVADGLPDNAVFGFFEDSKERVWIMPFKKEICFYQYGKIYNSFNTNLLKQLKLEDRCFSIAEDKYGNTYFASSQNIKVLNSSGSVIDITNLLNPKRTTSFLILTTDSTGSVILNINEKVCRLNNKFKLTVIDSFCKTPRYPWEASYSQNQLSYIFFNSVENKNKLYIQKNGRCKTHTIPNNVFKISSFSGDSVMFFSTPKGIFEYNTISHKQKIYFEKFSITDLLVNSKNNFFVMGVLNQGIVLQIKKKFIEINIEDNLKLPKEIYAIEKTGNSLFIGRSSCVMDEIVNHKYKSSIIFSETALKDNSFNIRCTRIKAINSKKIIIGTDNGAYTFNTITRKQSHLLSGTIKDIDVNSNQIIAALNNCILTTNLYQPMKIDTLLSERGTVVSNSNNEIFFGTLNDLIIRKNDKSTSLGSSFPFFRNRISGIIKAASGS